MSSFLSKEAYSIQEFYQEVQRELGSRLDKETTFASVLLSAIDFTFFCDMMNSVREGKGVIFCPPLIPVTDFEDDILCTQAMSKQSIIGAKDSSKSEFDKDYDGNIRRESDRDCKENNSDRANIYRK